MNRRFASLVFCALGLLVLAQVFPGGAMRAPSQRQRGAPSQAQLPPGFGQVPLAFELNAGQAGPTARYLARGNGYQLLLAPDAATLTLVPYQAPPAHPGGLPSALGSSAGAATSAPAVVTTRWLGANPHPVVTGEQPLPGTVNEFLGNDPAQWHTNIPTYAQVRYLNIYPGVDLVYYGNQGQLEFDFVVAPGADPARIQLGIQSGISGTSGTGRLATDLWGDLALQLPGGTVRQDRPQIYQQVNGARRAVVGGYALGAGGQVSFHLGAYDPRLPLIIDPVVRFSTYLGGASNDNALALTVDSLGNVYVTGNTFSGNFPTVNPLQGSGAGGFDATVTKYNPSGSTLLYSTYLGGSGDDNTTGIVLDSAGNVYLSGFTVSTNFPTTAGVFQTTNAGGSDAFVTKLNAAGNALVYSTYLGGSGSDVAYGIAIDGSGNAYVAGNTPSANFPTTVGALQTTFGGGGGAGDAFVTKLNATGTALVYSSYLGGSGDETAHAIVLDGATNAYITGNTASTDFPTTGGAFQTTAGGGGDMFVSKVNAAGSALIYSTYLGGSAAEYGEAIALDGSGNAYIGGGTSSTNFPLLNPWQATNAGLIDGTITELNSAGAGLVASTYYGGGGNDVITGLKLDASNNINVVVSSNSTDIPLANPIPGHSSYPGAGGVNVIARFSPSAADLLFAMYMGGSNGPGDGPAGLALGAYGHVYVAGTVWSTDFPTVNALQSSIGGGSDEFVYHIFLGLTPGQTIGTYRPSTHTFLLHNDNSTGFADVSLLFGTSGDIPLVGDWTGKGYASIGVFRPSNATFYLHNTNTSGGSTTVVRFGATTDLPVVGDWNGKGYDSVGVFRPSTGMFYLRNSNTTGGADVSVQFGQSGDVPLVGDWTGKGYDSIGVYRPATGAFRLRNTLTAGPPNETAFLGALGDTPVVGDWNGDGVTTIGVYRSSSATFYLRNSNTTGYADLSAAYGASGDAPLAGMWAIPLGDITPPHPHQPARVPAGQMARKEAGMP